MYTSTGLLCAETSLLHDKICWKSANTDSLKSQDRARHAIQDSGRMIVLSTRAIETITIPLLFKAAFLINVSIVKIIIVQQFI